MLTDLVAEFAESPEEMEVGSGSVDEGSVGVASIQGLQPWELYVDGAANQQGSGVGLIMVSPEKITIEKSLRLNFSATNNEAEYGGKGSKRFFGLEIGCWTGKRRSRSERFEDARIFMPGQEYTRKI